MRKVATATLTALMAVTAIIPAMTTSAEARRGRGAAIAGGVILGAAALAIIANSNRAHAGEYDDGYTAQERRWQRRCARLQHKCDAGYDIACEQYDDDCHGG